MTMRFEDLDVKTLEQIASPEVNARARELVETNQVQFAYRLVDRLQAVVEDEESHVVEARVKDDQLSWLCPCTQEEEGQICPHALALLWAWVTEPEKFLNRKDLLDRLKTYGKKDLLDIIIELADRVPEVRAVLKEEEQGQEDILESIDQIVEEVADDSIDAERAESRIRKAQISADRLAQSGRLSDARSIYFYILDNILSLEERLGKTSLFSKDLKEDLFEEYCQFIHEDRHLEKELVEAELKQLEKYGIFSRGEFDLTEIKEELRRAS
ncbi:MAG: SWIM zinc finger family protein [Desulfobaccales bacterium]